MNNLMPKTYPDAVQHESTEQMDLLQTSHQELEQALETLENLKPDEREDFSKRWPSTLQCRANQ
ncbi:hypothetical protein ACVBKF_02345 [Shewanella sp. 0m-11]